MKDFTIVIAVYGARHALELTLETLMAVGMNYIEGIILVDSSYRLRGTEFQQTAEYLEALTERYNFIGIDRTKRHPHGLKLDRGIMSVTTPYTLLLDSDVEFYDGSIFPTVQEMFNTDDNLFMVGHGDPIYQFEPRYIEEENLYVGGLFVRTKTAQKYVQNGVSFYRKDTIEHRQIPGTDLFGRMRIFYDVSSFMYKTAEKDGRRCQKLEMDGKYFKHLHHASWDQHQSDSTFRGIQDKLDQKVWLSLVQAS